MEGLEKSLSQFSLLGGERRNSTTLDGTILVDEQPATAAPNPQHHVNNLDLMDFGRTRRSRMSFVAPDATAGPLFRRPKKEPAEAAGDETNGLTPTTTTTDYGALLAAFDQVNEHDVEDDDNDLEDEYQEERKKFRPSSSPSHPCPAHRPLRLVRQGLSEIVEQLPAIFATVVLSLMVAIPFGAAYFPIQWSSSGSMDEDSNASSNGGDDPDADIHGVFPLPGKESLGIRMALFATCMGQFVMTFSSGFENPIAFQLLENVPFYHALAHVSGVFALLSALDQLSSYNAAFVLRMQTFDLTTNRRLSLKSKAMVWMLSQHSSFCLVCPR